MLPHRRWLMPVALILLAGCTHTYDIYLSGRTSGAGSKTEVQVTTGHPSGDISLTLKGKLYTGRWVYVSGGGSLNLATATAMSGGRAASATGIAAGLPNGGNGTMNLTADDGSSLHCVYDYSAWSRSGAGVCQGSDGEMYDIQISP